MEEAAERPAHAGDDGAEGVQRLGVQLGRLDLRAREEAHGVDEVTASVPLDGRVWLSLAGAEDARDGEAGIRLGDVEHRKHLHRDRGGFLGGVGHLENERAGVRADAEVLVALAVQGCRDPVGSVEPLGELGGLGKGQVRRRRRERVTFFGGGHGRPMICEPFPRQ